MELRETVRHLGPAVIKGVTPVAKALQALVEDRDRLERKVRQLEQKTFLEIGGVSESNTVNIASPDEIPKPRENPNVAYARETAARLEATPRGARLAALVDAGLVGSDKWELERRWGGLNLRTGAWQTDEEMLERAKLWREDEQRGNR